MTRSEFDTIVSTLTSKLRETLMQLALDNDHGVTDDTYQALLQCGLIDIFDDAPDAKQYYMPTNIHMLCCAWMSEGYGAPLSVREADAVWETQERKKARGK